MATEKRMIDANALQFEPDENCIANGVLIWGGRTGGKTMTTVLAALKKMIDNAPTVDAVEVVRCEHCVHSLCGGWICGGPSFTMPSHPTYPDAFCSYGERKTNEID